MILTTTPTVEGKIIARYIDIVGTEVIFGAMFLKDWIAEETDFTGGRNGIHKKIFQDARTEALREIRIKAEDIGADAVVNLRFAYQVPGEKNGRMMVAVNGSAVLLDYSPAERKRRNEEEKLPAAEDEPAHYIMRADKMAGPLSLLQLRPLAAEVKIAHDAMTSDEHGNVGRCIDQLIA